MADLDNEQISNTHQYASHICNVVGQLEENCRRRCISNVNFSLYIRPISINGDGRQSAKKHISLCRAQANEGSLRDFSHYEKNPLKTVGA